MISGKVKFRFSVDVCDIQPRPGLVTFQAFKSALNLSDQGVLINGIKPVLGGIQDAE